MNIISLREELINYFCHLLPKSVSITYDEKEIDQIIKDHLQQQVKVEPEVIQKIADLIEYHKKEASEPFLTLNTLKNFKTDKIEVKKIQRAMNGYTKMMKKKHLDWIKILESNFSA